MEILDLVQKIQCITPKPGDLLVISIDEHASENTMNRLCSAIRNKLTALGLTKENSPIIIYKGKIEIEIIRKEE